MKTKKLFYVIKQGKGFAVTHSPKFRHPKSNRRTMILVDSVADADQFEAELNDIVDWYIAESAK